MNKKILTAMVIGFVGVTVFHRAQKKDDLPLVAIANYGPHSTLEASIKGLKEELANQGFTENKTIRYEIADVGFDHSLIPQMITNLKNLKPKVMVVKSTPVAQFAKSKIKDIPLVFNDITDPVGVGLIKNRTEPDNNMTGASDTQDLVALLTFAKSLLPNSRTVGLLYATSDSNDIALVKMMQKAAYQTGMSVVAIPIDQPRDIPVRIQEFKGKVDFIYVGVSGPIQPSLPTIAQEAGKMNISIFNAGEQEVRDGLALASFGVDYKAVGRNAGKLVAKLLREADIKNLAPIYPTTQDHHGVINKKQAEKYGIKILASAEVV